MCGGFIDLDFNETRVYGWGWSRQSLQGHIENPFTRIPGLFTCAHASLVECGLSAKCAFTFQFCCLTFPCGISEPQGPAGLWVSGVHPWPCREVLPLYIQGQFSCPQLPPTLQAGHERQRVSHPSHWLKGFQILEVPGRLSSFQGPPPLPGLQGHQVENEEV